MRLSEFLQTVIPNKQLNCRLEGFTMLIKPWLLLLKWVKRGYILERDKANGRIYRRVQAYKKASLGD